MPINIKVIIGSIVGVGTVGGLGTGCYFFMQPKNLKEDLEKDGVKFLDVDSSNDDKEWEKIAAKFKDSANPVTGTNIKKLENVEDISKDTDNGMSKIKKQCKALFNKKIEKNETYKTIKQSAKDWCTNKSPFLSK